MARPTKLTEQVGDRIVQWIRSGSYAEPAARACGIAPSTYYRWLKRGEAEERGIYHEFATKVRVAEAEAEVFAAGTIRKAMSEDWRASVAFLERRYPSRWRRQTATELSGPNGGPVQTQDVSSLELGTLSDAELRLLAKLNARLSESANE